jgi:HK97 family phage major capsid protein
VTLEELRTRLDEIFGELRAIDAEAGDTVLAAEQQTRFDTLLAERQDVERQIAAIERRNEQRAAVAGLPAARVPGTVEGGDGAARNTGPNVILPGDPFAILEDRSLHGRQLVRALMDSNLRAMEGREVGGADNERHFERLLRRHAKDTDWAAGVLARNRDTYVDGWKKAVTGRELLLDAEERAALAIGTAAQGGYLVPTFLDPTLLLTNSGSSNVMRQYATVKTLTFGSAWNGVTSAGVTASWDAELAEVSDDTPNDLAQPNIPLKSPQAFVQASFEAFDDIDGLADDMLMAFADARDRLEGAAHMTGTGLTVNPTGLFTAINASSSLQITSTTAATIGVVDINSVYRALPVRFRSRGSWVCNPLYSLAVKTLGTAVSASYSGDLREPVATRWLDKPVVETDDAPTTQTTTALDQEIVFADLSEFLIIDKPGSTAIEFIPVMLGSNQLPKGTRGWYMHWRTGSGMPRLVAGRILVDKTSA